MQIHKFIVGELATNCYIVVDQSTNRCVIIDPGDGAEFLSEKILTNDYKPEMIIATHGHFDHVLGVYELKLAFNIPFALHYKDITLLERMNDSATYWLQREIIEQVPKVDQELKNGDLIVFGKSKLEVFDSPGHSPGGICLYSDNEKTVFTGDTLFANAIGRTDFKYGSSKEITNSILKIKSKFEGYKAYSGHGKTFLI